jgi:predicted regulator of Ras-like GTPase activity (Roadblock/LC7/MglB family)
MMTQTTPDQLLRSLRDVQGVTGSFVTSHDGQLLWRDMPAYFPNEALAEVAPRAARIFESWSADTENAECLVRFAEHKLYLHRLPDGLLCALLRSDVHMPSMRTAVHLVCRHLATALASRAPRPAPERASNEITRRSVPPEAQSHKPGRVYRGQRVD